MYEKIARHIGHSIEVASYGDPIVNVAVECMDCHEVIVDADNQDALERVRIHDYESGDHEENWLGL